MALLPSPTCSPRTAPSPSSRRSAPPMRKLQGEELVRAFQMRLTVSVSLVPSRLPFPGTLSGTSTGLIKLCRAHDFWIASAEFVDSRADAGSTSCPAPGERSRKDSQPKADRQEHSRGRGGVYHWRWGTAVQRTAGLGAPPRFYNDEKEAGYTRLCQPECQGRRITFVS